MPPECILSGPDTVNLSSTYYNTGQCQSHDTLTSIVICTTKIQCYRLSFDPDILHLSTTYYSTGQCVSHMTVSVLQTQFYPLCMCVCVLVCSFVFCVCVCVHVCGSPSPLKSAVQSVMVVTL